MGRESIILRPKGKQSKFVVDLDMIVTTTTTTTILWILIIM